MARVSCDLHNDAADQRLDLFQINLCGVTPAMADTAPPGDWWRGRLSREQRIWYPTWFCKTDAAAAAAKNGFATAPNCRKRTGAVIKDFCDLLEWNCCHYIPFIWSTLSIWPLHCYCTAAAAHYPIFANIRLSPECEMRWFPGLITSLRYYEPGRRVFSV